jgi:hypothetical protein
VTRFILNADPENMLLAMRAARWLHDQPPEQKDAILVYGVEWVFYVKRNKASITAHQDRKQL